MGNRQKKNRKKAISIQEELKFERTPLEESRENYLNEINERIKECENKEIVENIYLHVLQDNIYNEKKNYQKILQLEIEILDTFRKRAYEDVKDKFDEAEKLRLHYLDELSKQNNLYLSKIEEFNKRKNDLDIEYTSKIENLNIEYEKQAKQDFAELESLKDNLTNQIIINKAKKNELIQEYENLSKKLEEDYVNKDKELSTSYDEKVLELEKKSEKEKLDFDLFVKEKKQELESEKKSLEDEFSLKTKNLEQEYDEKIKLLEESFIKKEKDFEEYIEKEKLSLDKKKQDVDTYRDTVVKKVDEQIEDKKQALIDEMLYINMDYKNDLDIKAWEVEKSTKEFEKKAKIKELQILESTKEYENKVDKFNEEVSEFNNSKQKFLNEHHWLHILKRKVKEHMFASLICLAFLMTLSFFVVYTNQYKLLKNNFIASSINAYNKNKVTESEYSFSLNTKNSVLAKFTELDGLNIDVNTSKNNSFSENYEQILLNSGENNFNFERFYKNSKLVMKTPNYGQYIVYDDIDEAGYDYNEDEFNESVLDALKRSVSRNSNSNYTDISKINVKGTTSFIEFLNSTFFSTGNYEYFYTIENKDSALFKEMLTNIVTSENYKNFMLEESDIAKKLSKNNEFQSIEEIINGIIENSTVKKNVINLKISEDMELSNVDITFNLEYKDNTMASSVPLTINVRCALNKITEDISLEKESFQLNGVKYENINTTKKE